MSNSIQTVHLVFKTHLDVGFTDYARNVVNAYFTDFIPAAIRLAHQLREQGGRERFVWTTGSWLIYEYLEQSASAERKQMEDAITAGDIVWHGLPVTTHTELMDVSLFQFGLSLSQELDRRFGRKTIAAKMTDVPGHTRGIVPLLAEAGIQFLHIGVNQASTPPDVPPVFRWQDGDSEIVVMYQKGGYGDLMLVPGLPDALAFAHTNDNLGPQTADGVSHSFAAMRQHFPKADILASTMDAFAAQLASVKDSLPVITAELGDTWIHGTGSDPARISQFRELSRLRNKWLDEGSVKPDDKPFKAFSRRLLLIPEHTWGMDEKTYLGDYTHYDAVSFKAARTQPNFQKFESSWTEQRAYITEAVELLGDSPLRPQAEAALAAIKPVRPASDGYQKIADPSAAFETAHFTLAFDSYTGALISLVDKHTQRNWASADHPLGLFRYQTFAQADYDRFYRQYIINKRVTAHWSIDDYTKRGMDSANALSQMWLPQTAAVYHHRTADAHIFLLHLMLPAEASVQYGCPKTVTLEFTFPDAAPEIDVQLQWFDKPACRLPEAVWFSFSPRVRQPRNWRMEKLGEWISPLEVIRDGNRHLHAVGRGVDYQDEFTRLTIETLDATLLAPGEPSLLNFNNRQPSLKNGMHFNLLNNTWGTNFRMWYDDDANFRFIVRVDSRK
jgi:hypothetical protein